jgi:hypothetical protein
MSPEEKLVRSLIAEMDRLAQQPSPDHEDLHGRQDRLTEQVLRAIAGCAPDARALAAAAITVYDIPFERWCA